MLAVVRVGLPTTSRTIRGSIRLPMRLSEPQAKIEMWCWDRRTTDFPSKTRASTASSCSTCSSTCPSLRILWMNAGGFCVTGVARLRVRPMHSGGAGTTTPMCARSLERASACSLKTRACTSSVSHTSRCSLGPGHFPGSDNATSAPNSPGKWLGSRSLDAMYLLSQKNPPKRAR